MSDFSLKMHQIFGWDSVSDHAGELIALSRTPVGFGKREGERQRKRERTKRRGRGHVERQWEEIEEWRKDEGREKGGDRLEEG